MNDAEMRQHRAFRNPRRSGRVKDGDGVFFRDRRRRQSQNWPQQLSIVARSLDVSADRETDGESRLVRHGRNAICILRLVDDRSDSSVADHKAVFRQRLTDVDRHDDCAQSGAGEDCLREFNPVAENKSDPVAFPHSRASQIGRDQSDASHQLRIGDALLVVDEGCFFRECGDCIP